MLVFTQIQEYFYQFFGWVFSVVRQQYISYFFLTSSGIKNSSF